MIPIAHTPQEESEFGSLVDDYGGDTPPPDTSRLFRIPVAKPQRQLKRLTRRQERVKRAMDIAGAIVLAVVSWPVLLLAALAIKLTSRGPVFYSQTRVGINARDEKPDRRVLNVGPPEGGERRIATVDRRLREARGRPFRIAKLRTMRVDAEASGAQMVGKDDPRVTRVGRFLRRSRIDEIPQIVNVLKGDMSLVGPRPERPEFVEVLHKEVPGYLDRLGVKPGLTGLAQVVNGYDDGIESVRRKVRLDLTYLQVYSAAVDVKILVRTVGVVLTGKGAR